VTDPHPPDALLALRDALREFVAERDWKQFHTPRNLAIAISVEAGELLEPFQWLETGRSPELSEAARARVADELADVLSCVVRLADELDIDLPAAARAKLEQNRAKYPPDQVRGSARKYSEYG